MLERQGPSFLEGVRGWRHLAVSWSLRIEWLVTTFHFIKKADRRFSRSLLEIMANVAPHRFGLGSMCVG